jgi:non-specific serine/threonine protein kinase
MGLQSFVNEAKLLAQFTHPAMVKVYRFWEANGTGYMVMPYLRGPTLREVRRSLSQPPTEAWLRSVIDPLLDALAMLHAEGVYHRDIAPDNVLVSGAGIPVLLDFGAARRLIGDRTQSLTAILKPSYAPIEQYAEARQLRQGPWTDLYALAALVTYLLDGRPPPASTARAIHDDMEVLADRFIPGVSTTFLTAIDWALAVRPQDRPQNVAELRDALNGRLVPPPPIRQAVATMLMPVALPPPFPTTERIEPRVTPQPALSAAAQPKRRLALRPWLVATGSVLLLSALAWPPAWRPVAEATMAAAQALPQAPSVPPPETVTVVAPLSTAVEGGSAKPLQVAAVSHPAAAAELPAALAPPAKATKRTPKKSAPAAKPAPAKRTGFSSGPRELCAGRNVFTRPYCVQRTCEEPRFRNHSQCAQLRHEAQQRYRLD